VLWSALLLAGLAGPVLRAGAQLPPTVPLPRTPEWRGPDEAPDVREAPPDGDAAASDGSAAPDMDKPVRNTPRSAAEAVAAPHTPSAKTFPFDGGEGKRVVLIEVKDVIDLGLAPFLVRTIEAAEKSGDVVAFIAEIDTPGGRVDAAVTIRDALLRSKVPTIAWVNKQAISAGALIAYAHDYIVVAEGGSMGAATPVQMGGSGETAEPVEEKITSYMRSVMRATAEANGRDGDIAEAMVDRELEVPGVSAKGKLLTASMRQMLDWGLADARADTLEELLTVTKLTGATIERPEMSWAEHIARVLTHPVASSLLMTFGFLGLLIEFYTPGVGLPGAVGLACLLLFFAGHMIVHLAGWEELLLFLGGLVLLGLEIFVTPGFGVLGALGVGAILISLVLALIGLPLNVSFDSGGFVRALGQVAVAGLATVVIGFFVLRFLPRTGPGRRLVLLDVAGVGGPQTLPEPPDDLARERPRDGAQGSALVGAVGEALTDLRPAGRARLAGRRYDVVSEGGYLTRGAAVEVVSATPLRVVVRAARPGAPRPADQPASEA
jgi:membrane-bound serine protease (ClpP class)